MRATTNTKPGPVRQRRLPANACTRRAARLGRSLNRNGPKAGGQSTITNLGNGQYLFKYFSPATKIAGQGKVYTAIVDVQKGVLVTERYTQFADGSAGEFRGPFVSSWKPPTP